MLFGLVYTDVTPPTPIRFEMRPGDHRPAPGVARVHIRLDSWIDEAGNVVSTRVTQSTGMTDADDQLVRDWQTRHFKPALIDSQPIRALYRTDGESPRM